MENNWGDTPSATLKHVKSKEKMIKRFKTSPKPIPIVLLDCQDVDIV